MNKLFNKIAIAAIVTGAGLGITSCNGELEQYPIDYPGGGSFWTQQQQFTTNVYALAQMFRANYAGNIMFWAGELRAGTLNTNLINGSGALNVDYIANNYDQAHAQFSVFGNYFGFIADLNELLQHLGEVDEEILPADQNKWLSGFAYGMRAYCYFQMYRMYGGVPLRIEPDVVDGITNPDELYKARATAEETLQQIKSDIAASLENFNGTNWSFSSAKYYWNKACTEMLAGEVYLWSGKVTTGDHSANPADVTTAKTYFQNVVNNYNFKMLDDFFAVFTTPNNSETIFSVCYSSIDDGVDFSGIQAQFTWSKASGAGTNSWSTQDTTGLRLRTDGAVSRFGYFTGSETAKQVQYTCWNNYNPSPNRYMYYNSMFFQYDEQDVRRGVFMPQYVVKDDEQELTYIADFDPTKYELMGTWALKYRPSIVANWSQYYVFNNDAPIYRLPLAYLYLAEIANYEDNNGDVEKYINLVRQRAFGKNWDSAVNGYHAGNFRQNENAILREKDKEFLMEGQRWWDLRRLTAVKGGAQTDHLVFQPESCPGYGLDVVTHPWFVDYGGQEVATMTPVLSTSEEHKLLWPIDATLLGSDPLIEQNPGY